MASGPGGERPALRATLASSWEAAGGALARSLHLAAAADSDWEALLPPPAPGQDLVRLRSGRRGREAPPCCLYVSWAPAAAGEVLRVGVLSSARNMELYAGDEYRGTGRGRRLGEQPDTSEPEKVAFYRKYLLLEPPAAACKIKLLSFGDRQCVYVSRVVVHARPVLASTAPGPPALGPRIDLERVRAIMESMGSQLSPGAQQLMDMVRCQQQSWTPFGEQLQAALGGAGRPRGVDVRPSSPVTPDKAPRAPIPPRAGLTSGPSAADLSAHLATGAPPPGGGARTSPDACPAVPPSQPPPGSDPARAVSSLLLKKMSDAPGVPGAELLPFLQSLCGHVNLLRVGQGAPWPWPESGGPPREGAIGDRLEETRVGSHLEQLLAKSLEHLEKRLTDYIDQRLHRLQEHLDHQLALLPALLRSPGSPPAGLSLGHSDSDSGERLSNGER